jgi:hypothetical protein
MWVTDSHIDEALEVLKSWGFKYKTVVFNWVKTTSQGATNLDIAQLINEYGFPIVATVGLLYMIYFIWGFITNEIKLKLGETMVTLIGLIDRIRMLDNDIIRLQQKLDTVIELREAADRKDNKNSR